VCREEYELLEAAQEKLAVHHLTAPILGNNHNKFRSSGKPVRTTN
jgi:splicing factor 3B subunit 3